MKRDTVLLTKLQRLPITSDIVTRDRLLSQLESGFYRPLSLLSAPAGYGKSTLASQWVSSFDHDCVWISLDEEHNNLGLFLTYLITAIQQYFPTVKLKSELLLEADSLPSGKDVAFYLLNDIHELPSRFIFILDDYHRITNVDVHDVLTVFLEHPSDKAHWMVLTRQALPFSVAKLRGQGQINEIATADLRFDTDEVVAFVTSFLASPIDKDVASVLTSKTEGWAVGLRLISYYLQGECEPLEQIGFLSGSSQYIAEYMFEEVLLRQHPEIRQYLIETSVLERFCEPLCQRMHFQKSEITANDFMQLIQTHQLFIVSLDTEGKWFRFHHLFQDFLKGVLQKEYDEEQIATLHTNASSWFAENGLVEEAIEHLLIAGNLQKAVQLVIDNRYMLLNNSQFNRLNRWMAMFPEQVILDNPLLVTMKALIAFDLGKNVDISAFANKAEQMLKQSAEESDVCSILKGEVFLLKGIVDVVVYEDVKVGLNHIQEALELIPNNAEMVRSICIFMQSVCFQMLGDIQQAVQLIRTAILSMKYQDSIVARFNVCLCYLYFMDANLEATKVSVIDSLKIDKALVSYHTKGYAHYFHGVSLYQQNDLDAAKNQLQKVLDHPYAVNLTYVTESALIMECILLAQGKEEEADAVLSEIRSYCHSHHHSRGLAILQAFEVEVNLRRGAVLQACKMAGTIDMDVRPPSWFFFVPQLTKIKCLMHEGTVAVLDDAYEQLVHLDLQAGTMNRHNIRIEVLILLSLVCDLLGKKMLAVEHLLTALTLAEPGKWIRSFVDAGKGIETVLKQVEEEHPGNVFANTVMAALRQELSVSESSEVNANSRDILTSRETEIVSLLAEGLSNNEIAKKLCIAQVTVKTHLKNIYKKLNVKNRIEALIEAEKIRS